MTWGISHAFIYDFIVKQACFVQQSNSFLEWLLTYSGLPKFPRFPCLWSPPGISTTACASICITTSTTPAYVKEKVLIFSKKSFFFSLSLLMSENRVCCLVGAKPKDTTKPTIRKRRIYYHLQQVRKTLGIFSQAVSAWIQNLGRFKLREQACSWRGLSRGEFSIESQHRLTESKL